MAPKTTLFRSPTVFLAIAAGLLGVALPVWGARGASSDDAETRSTALWKVVAASGQVRTRPAITAGEAAWQRVHRGEQLESRSMLRTGRRGRATLTRAGSVLILDTDTELQLPESVADPSVIQTSGSVLYEVEGRSDPDFRVVTPYLVAGVKGTVFLVTVGDRFTSVSVERGAVEIQDPATGDRFELGIGESVLHDSEAAESEFFDTRARTKDPHMRHQARTLARLEHQRALHETSGVDGDEDRRRTQDDAWLELENESSEELHADDEGLDGV